jgi:hypothetical protein
LEGGPPRFLQDFSCPAVLGWSQTEFAEVSLYGAFTLYGRLFQAVLLPRELVTPPRIDSYAIVTPTTPHAATPVGLHIHGFRL